MSDAERMGASDGSARSEFLATHARFYREHLFEDIVPFWLAHARDRQCGGYATCLNRDGSVHDWTKLCMWNSGRIIWTFSHLYNELEPNPQWLDMARHGIDFVLEHGFTNEGRMWYSLTREGKPLEGPQDVFTELFHAAGFSEYARATGDETLGQRAWELLRAVWKRLQAPGQAHQPLLSESVPVRMFGHPLILLNVLDEVRRFRQRPEMPAMIDQCLAWIFDLHTDRQHRACFELVGWDGGAAPSYWGRKVCPGHMIEAGIFVIHEGQHRGSDALVESGVQFIEWGFNHGWDTEFGGLCNDIDIEGKPVPDSGAFLYQSKLWWQHAEALYGLLLAYSITGREHLLAAYRQVHDYTFSHFADKERGEWFALLDRRGNRIDDAKGTSRKSIFHVGRNCFHCLGLLENLTGPPGQSAGSSWK
jgi:N-acylglucosamine 2-epimerase